MPRIAAYFRKRKTRDETKQNSLNGPKNVTQTQHCVDEDFKMSVVQETQYFATHTNLYAVSDTLEKKLP